MAKELRIKIPEGEVSIPFSAAGDLEESLKDLGEILGVVKRRLSGIVTSEVQAKPGLGGIYTPGANGIPVLLRFPKAKIEAIGLAVFLSEPKGLTGPELDRVSHVKNTLRGFVNNALYKKYFEKKDGYVHLSHDGGRWVTEKVLPSLSGTSGV